MAMPPAMYSSALKEMEEQLARANSLVLTKLEPTKDEVNELTEGLKTDEADADWKKKVIYD